MHMQLVDKQQDQNTNANTRKEGRSLQTKGSKLLSDDDDVLSAMLRCGGRTVLQCCFVHRQTLLSYRICGCIRGELALHGTQARMQQSQHARVACGSERSLSPSALPLFAKLGRIQAMLARTRRTRLALLLCSERNMTQWCEAESPPENQPCRPRTQSSSTNGRVLNHHEP